VIAGDQEINQLEVSVDKQSLRLLALDQPMARDLRFIVGCMRIAIELERIADLAVNIAERALFLSSRPPLPPDPAMEQLAETAMDMLKMAIQAFITENSDQATEICQMDDIADELNVRVLKNLLEYMVHEVPAVETFRTDDHHARCLERGRGSDDQHRREHRLHQQGSEHQAPLPAVVRLELPLQSRPNQNSRQVHAEDQGDEHKRGCRTGAGGSARSGSRRSPAHTRDRAAPSPAQRWIPANAEKKTPPP